MNPLPNLSPSGRGRRVRGNQNSIMNFKKDLLILIPAYNEARFIADVVKKSAAYAAEVLVVDDGSTDDTAEVAAAAGARVIRHSVNQGKGAGLRTGFNYALQQGYQAVLTMDGDGQHRPEDIPSLLNRFRKSGAGIVVGCRSRNLGNMPLERFVTNWFTSTLVSLLARQRVQDSQCGFRIMKTKIIPSLSFATSHFDTESEVLVDASRAGFKISEAPICTVYGDEKSKQHPVRDTIRFFRFFFRRLFK